MDAGPQNLTSDLPVMLRARNLVAKGKGGNNDVFATIQLGREKFQTSTIKNALNPEWFEECDLPIPHMHSVVEVTLYHRGLLSDDFLGYAAVPIWERKVGDTPRSSWVSLQGRPSSKSGDGKYRGELEVKLAFLCHSKADFSQGSGLKKRTSSIRNLASVFGDKFRFTRSRSLRENRRDPEGEKMDRLQPGQAGPAMADGGEATRGRHVPPAHMLPRALPPPPYRPLPSTTTSSRPPLTYSSVHFSALDIGRAPWGVRGEETDNLTRSYSMSAAYIKSMSLERGPRVFNSTDANATSVKNNNNHNSSSSIGNGTSSINTTTITNTNANGKEIDSVDNTIGALDRLALNSSLDWTDTSAPNNYSQSVYNLPGERRSCAPELLPSHITSLPLARCARSQSQDDSALSRLLRDQGTSQSQSNRANRGRTMSDIQLGSSQNGIGCNTTSRAQDGSGALPAFLHPPPPPPPPPPSSLPGQVWRDQFYATIAGGGGGGIYESIKERTEPENSVSSSSSSTSDGESVPVPKSKRSKRPQKKLQNSVPLMGKSDLYQQQQQQHHQQQIQQIYRQPYRQPNSSNLERSIFRRDPKNSQGELVIRKRSRGERDRLRQARQAQGNRRYTVQNIESGPPGAYSDSQSEASASPRQEVPESLMTVYSNMNKEELLRVVIQAKAQMIRKDQYIRDLET
ncbi:rab11-interacting protein [Elysia marginata]|uniref:Rab11-interacting protein n=1 Tax=Elysia marginata TaxID=1093978 RepID=A0AAV4HUD0_9GAST|nr:rab11-interacting protein [Elysia marginata]